MTHSKSTKARKTKVSRWNIPDIGEKLHDLFENLNRLSDREAAIVGHSLIEALLEAAIQAHVVPETDPTLFEQGRPLSSFWGLFTMGHAFGIIPNIVKKELQTINDIRLKFAHGVHNIEFSTQEVADLCKALCLPKHYREVLSEVAGHLASDIEDEGGDNGFILLNPDGSEALKFLFHPNDLKDEKSKFL